MPASIINCEKWEEADVVLLGAPYDRTSSFGRGADKGPAAIRGCLDRQIEFYSRWTRKVPADELQIAYRDLGDLNGCEPYEMVQVVYRAYRELFDEGKFVVLLGGEHSVTNGPLRVISRDGGARRVTIVQLDAHFDLRDDDSDYNDEPWGKFAHSCVMRRASELNFPIVAVGVRAYSKDELDFALAHRDQITFFEIESQDIIATIQTDDVYLTVDVDGFDPAHMPATGTPVQGGIGWHWGLGFIRDVFARKRVIGADIVEVAPRLGDTLTEYGAAQIVYDMIAAKLAKGELGKK